MEPKSAFEKLEKACLFVAGGGEETHLRISSSIPFKEQFLGKSNALLEIHNKIIIASSLLRLTTLIACLPDYLKTAKALQP